MKVLCRGHKDLCCMGVVNQFTPAEALMGDAKNEIFMVTEHQEVLAKQAARQWSADMASVCTCSVLSIAVCDKVALDTDVRQLAAGSDKAVMMGDALSLSS